MYLDSNAFKRRKVTAPIKTIASSSERANIYDSSTFYTQASFSKIVPESQSFRMSTADFCTSLAIT